MEKSNNYRDTSNKTILFLVGITCYFACPCLAILLMPLVILMLMFALLLRFIILIMEFSGENFSFEQNKNNILNLVYGVTEIIGYSSFFCLMSPFLLLMIPLSILWCPISLFVIIILFICHLITFDYKKNFTE